MCMGLHNFRLPCITRQITTTGTPTWSAGGRQRVCFAGRCAVLLGTRVGDHYALDRIPGRRGDGEQRDDLLVSRSPAGVR